VDKVKEVFGVSEAPVLAELAQATPSPEGTSMGPNEVCFPTAALAYALHGSAWSAGAFEHSALTLSAVQVTAESIEKISAYASDEDKFSPGGG
jgi:hypothetical protein